MIKLSKTNLWGQLGLCLLTTLPRRLIWSVHSIISIVSLCLSAVHHMNNIYIQSCEFLMGGDKSLHWGFFNGWVFNLQYWPRFTVENQHIGWPWLLCWLMRAILIKKHKDNNRLCEASFGHSCVCIAVCLWVLIWTCSPLQEFKSFLMSEGTRSMPPSIIISTSWCQRGSIKSSSPPQRLRLSLSLTWGDVGVGHSAC